MNSNNPWNTLSTLFDTTHDESEISPRVADNMLIAWPVVLDFIKKYQPNAEHLRLLEYGCGSGSFANKLSKLGYKVTGIDYAEGMIKNAKAAYGKNVAFLCGESSILSKHSSFSIVTSVMTFQFVENIDKCFNDITSVLEKDGIFAFAVHSPAIIKAYLKAGVLFEDFDSNDTPKTGILNLGGNRIPIYIRTGEEYNEILKNKGFEPLLEEYPPFTDEFLKKYPVYDSIKTPEFLILGYRKIK